VRTEQLTMRPPTRAAVLSLASTSSRPTHFLALRLASPALHAAVAETQQAVIERAPALAGCDVPPAKSHLTAFVLHCADEDAVAAAKEALQACRALTALHFDASAPPSIELRGMSTFGNRVLYATVAPSRDAAQVRAFVAAVTAEFAAQGLIEGGGREWSPHLTILKTSRLRGKKAMRWPPSVRSQDWAGLEQLDLGVHPLPTLALCAMRGEGPDGYYDELSQIPLLPDA